MLTSCKTPQVYDILRRLCCLVIRQLIIIENLDSEVGQCVEYEISCWVDCMGNENIEQFCAKAEEATQLLPLECEIWMYNAWNQAEFPKPVPKLASSPLLVHAASSLCKGSLPPDMVNLVVLVLTKCLLFHNNPLPLATLIHFCFSTRVDEPAVQVAGDQDAAPTEALLKYTDSLVRFDRYSPSKRADLLNHLLKLHFTSQSFHLKVHKFLFHEGDDEDETLPECMASISRHDSVAAVRQLSHALVCTDDKLIQQKTLPLLRILLPLALKVSHISMICAIVVLIVFLVADLSRSLTECEGPYHASEGYFKPIGMVRFDGPEVLRTLRSVADAKAVLRPCH